LSATPTTEEPPGAIDPAVGPTAPVVHRRRGRSRAVVITVVVLLVAVAAGVAAFGVDFSTGKPAATVPLPPATAKVTRMTLTETEKVDGTLGYGDAHPVALRGTGTVTALPAAGSIVDRGQPVLRRDDLPVPLLYGSLPFYRVLRSGVSGADVQELEQNLVALGYKGFTADDDFTSSTADAVRSWQSDLGLKQTGTVDPTLAVTATGPIRVADVKANVGDPATGVILTYTGTTREVDIPLDVAKQDLVKVGISATVTLPDNSTVDGKVTAIGTVATSSGGGAGAAGGQSTTTIDVTVSVSDQSKLGTLDAAPVTVTLVSDTHPNVLTVPIAALLALAEGGYGVQVVDGQKVYYVAVKTGLFANGRVEISGTGVTEGLVVGIPA
jgi:peptidoglycan hydrolase-like protein with peptidoglycan-binding domain